MAGYRTVRQAAHRLGISKSLLYRLIAEHRFPAVRLAGRIVVADRAVDEWMDRQAANSVESEAS